MSDASKLAQAAEEAGWLVDRGYPSASASAFVAEHRGLDEADRKLLSCNARLHAQVRHHIAREMDAEDVHKRMLVVDAESALATVAAARAGRPLLESAANVHADPEWVRGAPLLEPETTLSALADVLDELRPARVRLVSSPDHRQALEEVARGLGKRKYKLEVESSDDVIAAMRGVGFVVSSDPAVLDGCATWVNAVGMVVKRLAPPLLRLTA